MSVGDEGGGSLGRQIHHPSFFSPLFFLCFPYHSTSISPSLSSFPLPIQIQYIACILLGNKETDEWYMVPAVKDRRAN